MEKRLQGGSLLVATFLMAVTLLPCVAPAEEAGPAGAQNRPVIKAAALYMVELKSGRVLLEKNATRRLPPASLTKIMTALVALDAAPLQEVVKIDRRAIVHHSSYNFRSGEEFLLRDLMTAMLVASVVQGLVGMQFLLALAVAVPGTLAGSWAGARLYRRLDDRRFDRVVLFVLLLSGLGLIWSSR